MKFPPWWGYGYFLELHNAEIQRERYCSLSKPKIAKYRGPNERNAIKREET